MFHFRQRTVGLEFQPAVSLELFPMFLPSLSGFVCQNAFERFTSAFDLIVVGGKAGDAAFSPRLVCGFYRLVDVRFGNSLRSANVVVIVVKAGRVGGIEYILLWLFDVMEELVILPVFEPALTRFFRFEFRNLRSVSERFTRLA